MLATHAGSAGPQCGERSNWRGHLPRRNGAVRLRRWRADAEDSRVEPAFHRANSPRRGVRMRRARGCGRAGGIADMAKRIVIVVALIVVVAAPFLLRTKRTNPIRTDDVVVIITPHNEA